MARQGRSLTLLSRSLVLDAGSVFLGSAVTAAFGFVFWLVMARNFSPSDIGIASAYQNALMLAATLGHLGLGVAYLRAAPASLGPRHRSAITSTVFISTLVSGGVVGTAIGAIVGLTIPDLGFLRTAAGLASFACASVLWTWFQPLLIDHVLLALGLRGWIVAKAVVAFLVRISVPFLLLALLPGAPALILGIVGSVAVADTLTIGIAVPSRASGWSWRRGRKLERLSELGRDSRPMFLSTLLWQGLTPLLPLLAVHLAGPASGAVFYVAWMLIVLVNLVGISMGTAILSRGSRGELNVQAILAALGATILAQGVALAILVAEGKHVLGFLAPEYVRGFDLILVFAPGTLAASVSAILQGVFRFTRSYRALLITAGVPAAVILVAMIANPIGASLVGLARAWEVGVVLSAVVGIAFFGFSRRVNS